MNWKKACLDDVIFENRNKAYGAYLLRQKYRGHIKKAALVGTSMFLLLVSSPLIADKMKGTYAFMDNTPVTIAELPKVEKPPVEPPKPKPLVTPPPEKQIKTISFTPPKVMDNPIEEPPLPKIETLSLYVAAWFLGTCWFAQNVMPPGWQAKGEAVSRLIVRDGEWWRARGFGNWNRRPGQ